LQPGHYFDYEIHPQVGEAGTYFYHSHVGFQAVSVNGPLLVEEESGCPPYQYDEERIFLLSDYFNKTDEQITSGLVQPVPGFIW
jgi:L-ascorbate oxidase